MPRKDPARSDQAGNNSNPKAAARQLSPDQARAVTGGAPPPASQRPADTADPNPVSNHGGHPGDGVGHVTGRFGRG